MLSAGHDSPSWKGGQSTEYSNTFLDLLSSQQLSQNVMEEDVGL